MPHMSTPLMSTLLILVATLFSQSRADIVLDLGTLNQDILELEREAGPKESIDHFLLARVAHEERLVRQWDKVRYSGLGEEVVQEKLADLQRLKASLPTWGGRTVADAERDLERTVGDWSIQELDLEKASSSPWSVASETSEECTSLLQGAWLPDASKKYLATLMADEVRSDGVGLPKDNTNVASVAYGLFGGTRCTDMKLFKAAVEAAKVKGKDGKAKPLTDCSETYPKFLNGVFLMLHLQQVKNPAYFCSHGADHGVRTMALCHKLYEATDEYKNSLKRVTGGVNAPFWNLLQGLLHDIGYPEFDTLKNSQKFLHAPSGERMVREVFGMDVKDARGEKVVEEDKSTGYLQAADKSDAKTVVEGLKAMAPEAPNDRNVVSQFLEAIGRHNFDVQGCNGSGNPDCQAKKKGKLTDKSEKTKLFSTEEFTDATDDTQKGKANIYRVYSEATVSASEDTADRPFMWACRIADNLDAQYGRLTPDQQSDDTMRFFMRAYASQDARGNKDAVEAWWGTVKESIYPDILACYKKSATDQACTHLATKMHLAGGGEPPLPTTPGAAAFSLAKACIGGAEDNMWGDWQSFSHFYSNWIIQSADFASQKGGGLKMTVTFRGSGSTPPVPPELDANKWIAPAVYQLTRAANALRSCLIKKDGQEAGTFADLLDVELSGITSAPSGLKLIDFKKRDDASNACPAETTTLTTATTEKCFKAGLCATTSFAAADLIGDETCKAHTPLMAGDCCP